MQTASGLSEVASQELGYSGNNRRSDFDYDSAGNLTNDDVLNYYWDAESRLKQSGQIGGGTVYYAYDGEGRRVKKTTSTGTTYYMYGITGLQSEFSTVNTGITAAASTDRLTFRVPEQTGTGVLLLNEAGAVVENNRVLPYGELFKAISGSTNDDKFTTYNRDSETGNDYAMARYYAKQYGAFLSPDPGHVGADPNDPRSWNAYVYVANDPINLTDPTGLLYEICNTGGECLGGFSDIDFELDFINGFNVALTGDPYPLGAKGNIIINGIYEGTYRHYKIDNEMTLFDAVALGTRMAEPGARLVYDAAKVLGSIVSPAATMGILCAAGDPDCSKGNVAMATIPGLGGLGKAGRVIKVLERAGNVIHIEISSARGSYQVMANMRRVGSTLVLDGVHMQGAGAGQFGSSMVREIREAAVQFGREQGVTEVIINPATRTSGLTQMRSFRVQVK